MDHHTVKKQDALQVGFDAELDRIYLKTAGHFVIQQNTEDHIQIQSTAKTTVVWNPWIDKAERLNDVENDAWQDFMCIECGQIGSERVKLKSGQSIEYELLIH